MIPFTGEPSRGNCILFAQYELTSSGREQKVVAQDGAGGEREVIQKAPRRFWGMTHTFIILIVVMMSQAHTYVKAEILNTCTGLDVKYSPAKL